MKKNDGTLTTVHLKVITKKRIGAQNNTFKHVCAFNNNKQTS